MSNFNKVIQNCLACKGLAIVVNGVKQNANLDDGTASLADGALKIYSKSSATGEWIIDLSLENTGDSPVSIGAVTVFDFEPEDNTQTMGDWLVFDFQDTLANANYVYNVKELDGKHWSQPFCLLLDKDSKQSFFAAMLTFDKADATFNLEFNPQTGAWKRLECHMAIEESTLNPGQKVHLDKLILLPSGNPFDLLCSWAARLKKDYGVSFPEPFAGLTTGTLIDDRAETPAEKIQLTLDGKRTRLANYPIRFFWISISNIKDGLPGNWLVNNDHSFPRGVVGLLQDIMDCGLEPGFWINPFYMCTGSKDFEKMLPFCIKDKDGKPSVRGKWLFASTEDQDIPMLYALDPACPETHEYIKEIFGEYAKWGIRYYMVDFLEAGRYGENEQRQGFGYEIYQNFIRKWRSFCAPDTVLLAATGASLRHIGSVTSSRIGMDYCEGRGLWPRWPTYPANYVVSGDFGSSGCPNKNAVQNLAAWFFAHDNFFLNNSNMLTVDKPIPLNEAIISTTLFGISPSPVFLGDDIKRMSEERLCLIKKILPRGKKMPIPIDLFKKTHIMEDFVRIFQLKVETKWDSFSVIAIFNLNDSFRTIHLDDELDLDKSKKYWLWNYWNESYLGQLPEASTIDLPGNSATVLRVTEVREYPWVLSTDANVRQGEDELDDVKWYPEKCELSGTYTRPDGEIGNLYVIAPPGWRERHYNRGYVVVKSALDNCIILKKSFVATGKPMCWKIEMEAFEPVASLV